MKIQIKKTKGQEDRPWHQDFRNPESLPDIKVIRTRFFLNFIAFLIPAIVAIFWVLEELNLGALRDEITKLEDEKTSMRSSNDELVTISREFMKESAKIESLNDYYYNLFPVSDYLLTLSDRASEDMVISSLELKKTNRVEGSKVEDVWESQISGYIAQGSQEAINAVNQFVEEIQEEELLDPFLDEAFLDNLARDQITDTFNFVVSVSMSDTNKTEGKVEQFYL